VTRQRAKPEINFSNYEPSYPRVFRLLRQAGWYEERKVDVVNVDVDDTGKARGDIRLTHAPREFLRSFGGLEVPRQGMYGSSFRTGSSHIYDNLLFAEHGSYIDKLASFDWPYPVLEFESSVGFMTKSAKVLAVDDYYQSCVHANDPFQLMDWIIDKKSQPSVVRAYNDYNQIPDDYWHLMWQHPLDFHLGQYKAHQLTEGDKTDFVLEKIVHEFIAIRVTEVAQRGEDLFVAYHKYEDNLDESVARDVIVYKIFDEGLGARYRDQTKRIHFTNLGNGKAVVLDWPKRRP